MLNFNPSWRLVTPGPIPPGVIPEFATLIRRVGGSYDSRWPTIEHYKRYFADAAGRPHHNSSSLDWAESDLNTYMKDAGANAPLFIEAFYDAGQALARRNEGIVVPTAKMINHYLNLHDAGYEVDPPHLHARKAQPMVTVNVLPSSLDAQAHEIIQRSLKQSEDYLSAGNHRQAVQEILWLLETVSTAFKGLPIGDTTIQGKYFNKIAVELKRHRKGQVAEQAIDWMTTLYGYLSSPTGGGVRHGATLSAGAELSPHEARLFCNLIRSYLYFLLDEYDQAKR
jgi:hypothetical protein